jgi:hypothetical protein
MKKRELMVGPYESKLGLAEIIESSGLTVTNNKIVFPSWVKNLKIDVGLSSNAPQSKKWLDEDPGLAVIGFEPVLKNVEAIRDGCSPWPIKINPSLVGKRLFILPIAVANVRELTSAVMYVTAKDSGCSSLLIPNDFEVASTELVKLMPLQALLEMIDDKYLQYVQHLKTDCQGSDLNVLKSAGDQISRILVVTAEPENRQYRNSNNSKKEIRQFLKGKGFINYRKIKQETKNLRWIFNVDDPTFVNYELFTRCRPKDIYIYQHG